ncbi:MAG: lipocalin family protein [Alistipes sp.]|nr:hypothetical protein [Rikenellaceae bacterium]MBR1962314.1 lipocalin family protein [Alistipes sp.]
MKKILKFALVIVAAVAAAACSKPDNNGLVFLDVTPNNIQGVWRMESYDNGVKLPEGSYYYIVFDRAERTFVTYDNLASMGVYKSSGRYDIVTDGAAVIRGIYDFGRGDWEHSYFVRNLTSDTMVWVATDDESIVQVYERAALPEELVTDEE